MSVKIQIEEETVDLCTAMGSVLRLLWSHPDLDITNEEHYRAVDFVVCSLVQKVREIDLEWGIERRQ